MVTNRIDARPTKEFFINMLTRDISTDRAILDLIDNSIDEMIKSGKKDAVIKLTMNKDSFAIEDNAGGLSLDLAKEYAFRFGRSATSPETPNSVGQFGVGMKRTLFKIATEFYVESNFNSIAYRVSVDVDEWVKTEEWDFVFELLDEPIIANGVTKIVVLNLREDARELFGDSTFQNDLVREIASAYFKQLLNGITILFNEKKVTGNEILIKTSATLGLIKKSFCVDGVDISITCGVTDRDLVKGGWNVLCNNRLVAEAEQSDVTGWGINGTPKYHADFAFFRGLVEFSCANSAKLPWTTTKTGVDRDSKIYKAALYQMSVCMQPITSFLRERAEETTFFSDGKIPDNPLSRSIAEATPLEIFSASVSEKFQRPAKLSAPKENRDATTIQYTLPLVKVERAKSSLGASTNKQVGEMTFEYYYRYECGDE